MGVIQPRDLSKHVIKSAADGLELVKKATANRRVRFCLLCDDDYDRVLLSWLLFV